MSDTPLTDTTSGDAVDNPSAVEVPAEIAALRHEEAATRLKGILSELESGRLDVDEVADRVQMTRILAAHCRNKIAGARAEVSKILASS